MIVNTDKTPMFEHRQYFYQLIQELKAHGFLKTEWVERIKQPRTETTFEVKESYEVLRENYEIFELGNFETDLGTHDLVQSGVDGTPRWAYRHCQGDFRRRRNPAD